MCYPLTFSATDFYLGHDLALLTANIKSDLRFVSQRWNQEGQYGTCASYSRTRSSVTKEMSRPTYCIVRLKFNVRLFFHNHFLIIDQMFYVKGIHFSLNVIILGNNRK